MKARLVMGPAITLTKEDKLLLNSQNTLECTLFDFPNQKVYLHVFEDIDLIVKRNSLECEGFHIQADPPISAIKDKIRYDIFINRKVIEILLSEPNNLSKGNHFGSRSRYDWVDLNYFGF